MPRLLIAVAFAVLSPLHAALAQIPVRLTLDPAVQKGEYSGRIYVVLVRGGGQEPRLSLDNWFSPPQVIAEDVQGVVPGASLVFDASALGFPRAPGEIKPGSYTIQAIARRSLDGPIPGQGTADLYSEPVKATYPPADGTTINLTLSRVVEAKPFKESQRVKFVEIDSAKLSAFHGRPVKMRAAVLLPDDWTDSPDDSRPVLYFITGFGGDHTTARHLTGMLAAPAGGGGAGGVRKPLIVVPDPTNSTGHSVFADSDNNGPWGTALVEELIPVVEKKFHAKGGARSRYVMGISSGGWSSLWLQMAYPDSFNGCWSHCPDPVDFRDFQRIDLYAPGANMYTDPAGKRRPLARAGPGGGGADGEEPVLLWYDDFCRMERVLGHGGQIGSFEAVFSRRAADGQPVPLFDRDTGVVNAETAKTWERYDIRLVLERNWATLGPKLKGKIHVYAGDVDTFYLDGAARLLKESLQKLGSDAEVVIVPKMPHTIHRPGVEAMMKAITGPAAAR